MSYHDQIEEQSYEPGKYYLLSEFSRSNFLIEEEKSKKLYYKIGNTLLDSDGQHIILTKPESSYFRVVLGI